MGDKPVENTEQSTPASGKQYEQAATLGRQPASEIAARYRLRLGMFTEALQRRPVVTTEQQVSKQHLIHALINRYTWLNS